MSQNSFNSSGGDFHMPDEILAVIPTYPYEQLDLAMKITSMAIASRVSNLELEVGRMRQKLHEKDRVILELESKATRLEQVCYESESRLKTVLEDNDGFCCTSLQYILSIQRCIFDPPKPISQGPTPQLLFLRVLEHILDGGYCQQELLEVFFEISQSMILLSDPYGKIFRQLFNNRTYYNGNCCNLHCGRKYSYSRLVYLF